MIKIPKSDYGSYKRRYFNSLYSAILPDLDASLIWEFRDSAGTLRFTATLTSTPALVASSDIGGPFIELNGMTLSAYASGIVDVACYANVGGVPITPSPELATAFEVVDDGDLVDQLRTILRLDDSSQDGYLLSLITSAAEYAKEYLGRTLLSATRVKQFDIPVSRGLSQSSLKMPTLLLTYPPVIAITRVYAKDVDGEETDIDSADYWLDGDSTPPELQLNDWNWEGKLRVIYTCGYGATYADCPVSIQRGILLHAAYLFKFRGDCPDGEAAQKSGAWAAYNIYKVVRR